MAIMRLPQFLDPSLSSTAPPTRGPANSSTISAKWLPLYDLQTAPVLRIRGAEAVFTKSNDLLRLMRLNNSVTYNDFH